MCKLSSVVREETMDYTDSALDASYQLHPTSLFYVAVRWESSSFSSRFFHGRWRLTTEIPIFTSLYHLFCGFKNAQK